MKVNMITSVKTTACIFSTVIVILQLLSCNQKRAADTNNNQQAITDDSLKNLKVCTELISVKTKNGKNKLAFGKPDLFWPDDKKTLYIEFLDGDPTIKQRVIVSAKKWEPYCGLTFRFGDFDKPDITISFKHQGSWSYIGSSSSLQQPSMNFGWFNSQTSQLEYDRVVLHEFGHALGLYHEHQNPMGNPIHWNKEVVYRYYMDPPNSWPREQIDQNVFERYESSEMNGTSFDSKSIMEYPVPISFTTDGYHNDFNYTLSEGDKFVIKTIYPKKLEN